MKTIKEIEALILLNKILEHFDLMLDASNTLPNIKAKIENVAFVDFFKVCNRMPDKKMLYMPGEIGTETMVVIYKPFPGLTITIESEQCVKFIPKINTINYN